MIGGLALLVAAHALVPVGAVANPLVVKPGETWLFALRHGEPVSARRAAPGMATPKGQFKVTVARLMGTSMTISTNGPVSYTYRAELIGGGTSPARTCAVPGGNIPALEFWPGKADAVRLSRFRPARAGGSCPSPH